MCAHANALAGGTVPIETCFSASPDEEAMMFSVKGRHDEGIGQDRIYDLVVKTVYVFLPG